jgi:hypothetical protein
MLASRSSRNNSSYRKLLVSFCLFIIVVVKNIATLIPGYVVALLVFLDMQTFISIFVALPLFLASNTCFQGGFVIKKGGTSGTWAKRHDNPTPKMQQHILLNKKVISVFVATYLLAGRRQQLYKQHIGQQESSHPCCPYCVHRLWAALGGMIGRWDM